MAPPYKTNFAIGTVWLFHLSAIVGISLGYAEWFMSKSSFNLLLCSILFALVYPLDNARKLSVLALFFTLGMVLEWLGVTRGLFFGNYSYGENLGIKIGGVPLLIGMYWALLTFITAEIASLLFKQRGLLVIVGALMMVGLDFLMERSAPVFDFWTFREGLAPLQNYVAWFLIAAIFHLIFHFFRIRGNKAFSLHFYLAQILFFGYFYWFF